MNGEKQGRWVQGHKDWHTYPPPPMIAPSKLFLLLNGLFSPVYPMNYVNDYGIPFFPRPEEGRKREEEKTEVREMPPPRFFFLSLPNTASEQPFMLAVWAWVSTLRPCERMMVAAELVEGEGQGTMTYMRNREGRQGKNAGLVVG